MRHPGARRWQAETNQERRSIETLAQALYEASNPGGVAWARRTQIVRDPWLGRARQNLQAIEAAGNTIEGNSQDIRNDEN